MEPTNIRETLQRAEERVRNYLARHGVELPQVSIVIDHELEKGALATHRYPATVVAWRGDTGVEVPAREPI